MLKVLQFPVRNNKGGVTKYILDHWRYIDKSKFHFDFVTLNKSLPFEKELSDEGAKVYHITCTAEQDEEDFKRQLGEILKQGYDIIHIHTGAWKSTAVEEVAAAYCVPRIIIHAHSSGYVSNASAEELQKLITHHEKIKSKITEKMANDFWACSTEASKWLYGTQIPADRIKILKDGIDTEKFCFSPEKREKERKKYHLENCLVLGHVGRFSKEKNQEFLLGVLEKLIERKKKVRLIFVGDGKLKDDIVCKAEEKGILQYVILAGQTENVEDFYQMMDLFLLPSSFEGFSISLMEAQAMGVPCIASSSVTRECDVTGMVSYLPLDSESWVNRICELAEFSHDRSELGERVKACGFDIRDTAKKLEQLYEN